MIYEVALINLQTANLRAQLGLGFGLLGELLNLPAEALELQTKAC